MTGHEGRIREIKDRIARLEGRREALADNLSRVDAQVGSIRRRQDALDGASDLISAASARSREEVKARIERAVTHAIRRVMEDDNYRFEIVLEEKRGRLEAACVLHTALSSGDPMEGNGYGIVDVIATTLRLIVKLTLGIPGPIIMDEPAKFLDREHQPNYMRMLREYSRETGTQIILCTHVSEHMNAADRTFEVELVDGQSRVRNVG